MSIVAERAPIKAGLEPAFLFEGPRLEKDQPTRDEVVAHFRDSVAQTALKGAILIDRGYAFGPITEEERQNLEVNLDLETTPILSRNIHMGRFKTSVISCEGEKENRKYGIVLPIIRGVHGFGEMFSHETREVFPSYLDGLPEVKVVVDPLEGTKKASKNEDGSIVVAAGSVKGELGEIPGEDTSALYTNRIVAGPRVAEVIARTQGTEYLNNTASLVEIVLQAYGIEEPSQIEVIVMDRARNDRLKKELTALGVTNIRLIDSGDLTPAFEVLTSDKPMLSIGSGGKQEAAIAAYAAKALGGYYEAKYVGKEGEDVEEYPDTISLDDAAPGNASDYFVVFGSVTGVENLGMDRVSRFSNGKTHYEIPVGVISSSSSKIEIASVSLPSPVPSF